MPKPQNWGKKSTWIHTRGAELTPRAQPESPKSRLNAKFLSPRVLEKGQFDHELGMESNVKQQMSAMETIVENSGSPIWVIVMLILFHSFVSLYYSDFLHVRCSCACGWRGTMRVVVGWARRRRRIRGLLELTFKKNVFGIPILAILLHCYLHK